MDADQPIAETVVAEVTADAPADAAAERPATLPGDDGMAETASDRDLPD